MTREYPEIDAALSDLGLSVQSVFVPFSQSRNKDEKHKSLNWKVTVQRKGRDVLTADYSAGVAHCPSYKPRLTLCESEALEYELETGKTAKRVSAGAILGGKPILPGPRDVIYSLTMDADVLNYATFEDWASEYGYDPDSRSAEATYKACLEIGLKLRAAVGDAGLERLNAAFQDY